MGFAWKPKTEMDFACLHESGHAVVAKAAGCAVNRVMVRQEGEVRIGITDYQLPTHLSFAPARAMEIGILHGGKAAESTIANRDSSRGILQDQRDIERLISQLQMMGPLEFTEGELLEHCDSRARAIVRANKVAIVKLAKLLSKRGLVEGQQLQAILSGVSLPQSA